MSGSENKTIVLRLMEALSRGDTGPFAEAMSDDFTWHVGGSTAWSGSYHGKVDVRGRLLKSLFAQFATP